MPNPTEAKTRKELIDPALKKAGWDATNPDQVRIEIPVDGFDPQARQRLETKLKRLREEGVPYKLNLPKGISDYALYRPNGEIIAVVEAKRTSIHPRLAQAQTEFYVTELEQRQSFRPFAFMTNALPLQQKFSRIVQKYKRLRAQQRESARQAEHLFQSLLHRAFQGEV